MPATAPDAALPCAAAREHSSSTPLIAAALALKLPVLGLEAGLAVASGSLFLLADAIHLAADIGAFGTALVAAWIAERRRRRGKPGYSGFEIASGAVNGAVLLLAGGWVVLEAWEAIGAVSADHAHHHHHEPAHAHAHSHAHSHAGLGTGLALVAATTRLLGNFFSMRLLRRGDTDNPNVAAVEAHCRVETIGSAALIGAIALSAATGFAYADPVISIFIAGLVLRTGARVLQRSLRMWHENQQGIERPRGVVACAH